MLTIRLLSFFVLLAIVTTTQCARILGVFLVPSISHQVVLRKISLELANRGHQLVIITTDPTGHKLKNVTEIDVHNVSYSYWNRDFVPKMTGIYEELNFLEILYEGLIGVFDVQMHSPAVQEFIKRKNEKFDLIIYDALSRSALGFAAVFNAPVVGVSTLQLTAEQSGLMGVPRHPIFYPNPASMLNIRTIWNKAIEIYRHFMMYTVEPRIMNSLGNKMMKKAFGDDCPDVDELSDKVHMMFTDADSFFLGNRPLPPSVVSLGAIHLVSRKPLSKELQTYLDNSTNGVIFLSFGTNVMPSALPPPIQEAILKVLSNLPYDIMLKWDVPVENLPKNMRIQKWWPQNDLLVHPKIKLFITQGGLQSTTESITAGVPMISLPILGDQYYNGYLYEKYGIGKRILLSEFTEENFKEAIETILGDQSYQDNIKRLGHLMRDQPEPPLERAMWWIEYVIRNGGARHLRSPVAGVSWFEYLLLDVVLVLLLSALAFLMVAYLAVTRFVKIVKYSFNGKIGKEKKKSE